MPRKSRFTTRGRNFLQRSNTQRRRDYRRPSDAPPPNVVLPNGDTLNVPESAIYRALVDLDVPFQAQKLVGKPGTLGSSDIDFYLPTYRIAIEFQGRFHNTTEGQARDFWRKLNREALGLRVVYAYERDLDPSPHAWLKQVIGAPHLSAVAGRR